MDCSQISTAHHYSCNNLIGNRTTKCWPWRWAPINHFFVGAAPRHEARWCASCARVRAWPVCVCGGRWKNPFLSPQVLHCWGRQGPPNKCPLPTPMSASLCVWGTRETHYRKGRCAAAAPPSAPTLQPPIFSSCPVFRGRRRVAGGGARRLYDEPGTQHLASCLSSWSARTAGAPTGLCGQAGMAVLPARHLAIFPVIPGWKLSNRAPPRPVSLPVPLPA